MIKKILLFLLLINSGIAFGQTRFVVNIDSLSEVSLPVKPGYKKTDSSEVYFAKTPSAYYLIIVQKFNTRKGFSLQEDQLEPFYQATINGNLNFAKGQLLSKKDIVIDSLKAVDFIYKTKDPKLPDLRFQRSIFLNKTMINYCFWTYTDSAKVALPLRDKFYKSIIIIANEERSKQYTDKSIAYQMGDFLGRNIFIISIITAIAVVITLVKKIKSKKASNNEPT